MEYNILLIKMETYLSIMDYLTRYFSYNYFSGVNCNDSIYADWIVNGQSWWTKSAYPHTDIDLWKVEIDGRLNGNRHSSANTIRPVVVVSKKVFDINSLIKIKYFN